MKSFAYAGAWSKTGEGGIGIYQYSVDTGELELLKVVRKDISAGFTLLDEKKNVLYVADEREESPEYGTNAGGCVFAMKIDPKTGDLEEMNHYSSLGILPACLSFDGAGKGILICNHSSAASVYQIRTSESGAIYREQIYNDTPVVHYPILEDGSLGEPDAVLVTPNREGLYSCLHSISLAPDGRTMILCERNQDIVYMLHYDATGKKVVIDDALQLQRAGEGMAKDGDCPRYIAFHPTLPIVYVNSEYHPLLFRISYAEGRLELTGRYDVTPAAANGRKFSQSDLCISADGKYLYNLYRQINMVCVHSLDEKTGEPSMIQEVQLEGEGPRSCLLSPDGRYLLVANLDSGDVTSLAVREDGTLDPCGRRTMGQKRPGNIRVYCE
ncbi:MAG: lactonase family protein [Clostridiales bacterium]|nr:lactonase family protein [Clostridiales bacterium]